MSEKLIPPMTDIDEYLKELLSKHGKKGGRSKSPRKRASSQKNAERARAAKAAKRDGK